MKILTMIHIISCCAMLRLKMPLIARACHYVWTVRMNRREIPPEMKKWDKPSDKTPLYASEFFRTEAAILVASKAEKHKTVYLLFTMHKNPTIVESDMKKPPEVVLFYNHIKGGVDTTDQMLHGYSSEPPEDGVYLLTSSFSILQL